MTSYSILAGSLRGCEVKLKLVVAGSRPSVFCLRAANYPGLSRGISAAGVGPSWVGGTRGMPSGEIWRETDLARGASIGLAVGQTWKSDKHGFTPPHLPVFLCFACMALPPTCSCFVFSPISRSTSRQKNAAR